MNENKREKIENKLLLILCICVFVIGVLWQLACIRHYNDLGVGYAIIDYVGGLIVILAASGTMYEYFIRNWGMAKLGKRGEKKGPEEKPAER